MPHLRMNSPVGKAILALVRDGDYAPPGEESAIVLAATRIGRAGVRRVLDVGCGRGGTADWFQRPGWGEIVGIDVDADSVRYARSRYPDMALFDTDVGELDRLALAPLDLVYLLTANYAFADQPLALRQLTGACRPGGRLLLVDYTRPAEGAPPAELGAEIGRPVVLDALSEALVAGAWTDVCIEDWTPSFIQWYAQLLERIRAHRPDIIAEWGPDWYGYVRGWYSALHKALVSGRLGGAVVTATRGRPD